MAETTVYRSDILDKETGEIVPGLSVKVSHLRKEEDVKFVMMFIKPRDEATNRLLRLRGGETSVFLWCCANCVFDENTITLTKLKKERMAADCQIKYSSISNAVASLVRKGFLARKGTSEYEINQEYSWRGYAKNRKSELDKPKEKKDAE